jgi:outer membrane protein OmpA-like peptidoglycan-associated protein
MIALVFALAACTTQRPRPHAPSARPPTRVAAPAAAPSPRITRTEPENYEQEKIRIKRALAGNERDSLAASEVGYYMDVLFGRLKQIGRGAAVTRQRDSIVVQLSVRSGFQPDGVELAPSLRNALSPFAKALLEYRKTLTSVRVRVDGSGNSRLADQRASAVARELAELGIAGRRILVAGAGAGAGARAPATRVNLENIARVELRIEPVVRSDPGKH